MLEERNRESEKLTQRVYFKIHFQLNSSVLLNFFIRMYIYYMGVLQK